MAPPISSWSTTFIRFSMTSILSDTFAPPKIATQGRCGILRHLVQIFEFLVHQQPGGGLGHELDHADRGGVRAMRGAERIVHVHIA